MNRYIYIEIDYIEDFSADTAALCRAAHDIGLKNITTIYKSRLFFLSHADLTDKQIDTLCSTLLADPVIEQFRWERVSGDSRVSAADLPIIEVEFLPGVTDRVAYEIKQATIRLGLPPVQVITGFQYRIEGEATQAELHKLAQQLLCNEVVQSYRLGRIEPVFIENRAGDGLIEHINLQGLRDKQLIELSQTRRLALNLEEMAVLRRFSQDRQRLLTDAELEMVAQTWSEHCFHKTFKAKISYKEIDENGQTIYKELIDGLLDTYIRAATEACSKDWLVSTFVDNAGIIEFDGENHLSFKVETHNHPSALEPFGGANTGVGGVIRDIVGVSARPIAVTNVLCFGLQDLPAEQLPAGTLHPRRVQSGVVAGIGDYGNKMGIPTVNGAVIYHQGYTANPLVYCGCVGLAPADSHVTAPQIGDRLIVLGGRTGRDGLRGATFSSLDLDSETSKASFASTAVQIGDPIVEKDVTEVVMLARDAGLYNAITDCGAGGLSSAIGEMAQKLGAEVELSQVGLKYSGLRPWEIWLSEAQERIILAVPSENLGQLSELCRLYSVDWDDIGRMSGDGQMVVKFNGHKVVNLPMELLHDGHPQPSLKAEWRRKPEQSVDHSKLDSIDPAQALLTLLSDPNTASKEAIIRTYDHEVQGGTVIKPLTGYRNHGPSDAAVLKPLPAKNSFMGIAISNGINPAYGLLDPYSMAVSAVDEAVRNAIAVGGDPDRLAILDNFCWGNPNLPDRLGGLTLAAKGCYDAARAFDLPFISGKDSLNNEYVGSDGQRIPIPGTLLISAIAIVPDIRQAVTMDLKEVGNLLYIVGETADELGGSLLFAHYKLDGGTVPGLPQNGLKTARNLHQTIKQGLVRSCHDLSEGGLAVSAAEMALAGGLGLSLDLESVPSFDAHPLITLFSESNGRWLVEVSPGNRAKFEAIISASPAAYCGEVTQQPLLRIGAIELEVSRLEQAWLGEV